MSLKFRRVVTGHDNTGKACVKVDDIPTNIMANRPGTSSCVVWSTNGFPVDNDGFSDPTGAKIATTVDNGSVFRLVRFEPGNGARNHRTDSIDYAIVMSGEIDMDLDGEVVHLEAGDVLVQRGTIHNWINKGREACVIAFVLVSAKPVTVNGKRLDAHG